jgi:hypothetical protein
MPNIQDRLLDSISMVLSKSPYLGRPAQSVGRGTIITVTQQVSELSGSALIQLALQTLARFNFKVLYTHFMYELLAHMKTASIFLVFLSHLKMAKGCNTILLC